MQTALLAGLRVHTIMARCLSCSQPNFTELGKGHLAKAFALIDAALAEPDPVKNSAMWKKVQALIYEDQPYMFLYWMDEIVGVHGRFENAKVNVLSPFHELWSWSVDPNQVKYAR